MAVMVLGGSGSALAWMLQIDPGTTGATSHNINFIADGDTVDLYGYTLVFDYTGANLTGGTETPPAPLAALFGPYNDTGGTVDFTAVGFVPPYVTLSADTTLATFTFDGNAILDWNLLSSSFIVTINAVTGNDSTVTDLTGANFQKNGNAINPVPLPSAIWLFGSALAGLVGIRRKVFVS